MPVSPVITAPFLYWRYRLGRMDPRDIRQEIPSLRGLTRDQLESVAANSFEARIKPNIFDEAERRIREINADGGEVVFATLSVDLIIKPLADYLGVKNVVASSFQFESGTCTGRFEGGPIFNVEKRNRVLEYIGRRDGDPQTCVFYSDSINDLPLLEAVGKPVAVNPDRKLRRVAALRGWQVCRWK